MNDVLINTFSGIFNLRPSELSFIQLAFFGAFFFVSLLYFLLSNITKTDPINKIGYKNGIAISLLICGLGCSSFYLAALNESYDQFITSLIILAVGVTFLQICANPYAAILGTTESASSRLNLAQGFNSLGTTLGPIVGNIMIYGFFIKSGILQAVGSTYLIYGIVFLIMAIAVKISNLPSFEKQDARTFGLGIFKNKQLNLGIVAIFFYVGSEVAVGSWIGTFGKDPLIMGLDEQAANSFLAFFWGGLMIGRLMASVSLNKVKSNARKISEMFLISILVFGFLWLVKGISVHTEPILSFTFSPLSFSELWIYLIFLFINFFAFILGKGNASRLIIIFCSINLILLAIGILGTGALAFWSILGTGLFFSVGWSNIFSLSIQGLGSQTSQGSSLLIMAIVGGAILPFIQSKITETASIQVSFIVPLIGMVYLIFFGFYSMNKVGNKAFKPQD